MTADRVLVMQDLRKRYPGQHPCVIACFFVLSLELALAPLAWTVEFAFAPVDGPNASATELHGINHAGQFVGTFRDAKGTHGLVCASPVDALCSPQLLTPLDLWFNGSQAVSTQVMGITTAGRMAGFFLDFKGESHGFLCAGFPANLECHQFDVTIDHVLMANTLILGIHEQGQFVGSYRDSQSRINGYLYVDGSFTRVDVPGALATVVSGIASARGEIPTRVVGFFLDAKLANHGFLCTLPVSHHCFTTFDVTLDGVPQIATQAVGISGNQIVGSFRDPNGKTHGFLCTLPVTAACFAQLDALNGIHTQILGINDRGQIVGHFSHASGGQRGFIANVPPWMSAGVIQ